MAELRFTLIGEGSTDDALMPIIQWLLEHPSLGLLPDVEIDARFVSRELFPGEYGLEEHIAATFQDIPSNLIFVHQDADAPTATVHAREINVAIPNARRQVRDLSPAIPVVPVREMEAWLLIDEPAIRRVARNPHGRAGLSLPRVHEIESCLAPKAILRDALRAASELPRRRWTRVDRIRPRDVADEIEDFSPLRQLPAFRAFETDVRRVIAEQGWPGRLG